MVAWHEVPGNQQKAVDVPEGRYEAWPRGYKSEHVSRDFHRSLQTIPSLRDGPCFSFFQALRARLPSLRPYGTR